MKFASSYRICSITIFMFWVYGITVQAQLLKLGDNLYTYIQQFPPSFNFPAQKVNNWSEGETNMYSYSQEQDPTKPYILHTGGGKFLMGVLQGASPNAYYLFDTDGDQLLDLKTDQWLVPYWVVGVNSKQSESSKNVDAVFDKLFGAFNEDEGPASPSMLEGVMEMMNYYSDTTYLNREFIYLLDQYLNNGESLVMAENWIELLRQAYKKRFNKVHPLIYLFQAETQLQIGNLKEAKKILRELYAARPSYLPARYYMCVHDFDGHGKKAKSLMNEFPNHWLIKTLQ